MGRKTNVITLCGLTAVMLAPASAVAQQDRGSATEKGSLFYFHKVEVRWGGANPFPLQQDTFLSLTNDENGPSIRVEMQFVNGDPPTPPVENAGGVVIERGHPGWNQLDNQITLTQNQPVYWSALTGQPANGGLSPWTALDPAGIGGPGRPATDGSGDRVLRGFIVGWAVNDQGDEMRWNHLAGNGTILNYTGGYAWEYNTLNHAVVAAGTVDGDEPDLVAGQINLDGTEYSWSFDTLLFNFQAALSQAWGNGAPRTVISNTDLTLHPASLDATQGGQFGPPITTKASFTVWNENEVKMSGAHRCITCWDQTLLSIYDLPPTTPPSPNHFLVGNLQTDHGKAIIDGLAAAVCNFDFDQGDGLPIGDDPRDVLSEDAAIVGVAARILLIDFGLAGADVAASGYNLVGRGEEAATILFGGPSPAGGDIDAMPETPLDVIDWLEKEAGISTNLAAPKRR